MIGTGSSTNDLNRQEQDILGRVTSGGQSAPHLDYRPEVDGLRAIAVLAVVLYHFGVGGLGGGFVGVDIFFVISGFLIGGLLWKELDERGGVDLGRFYLRRVRRLAPAYLAMAIVSTIAAWVILLPFEFREFGKHLIAATVWLSNVQFWREAGYFDVAADSKVLLHTWSLSVEEQFYVVLPILLILLKFSRRISGAVVGAAWAASLLACIAVTPGDPVATFFLFPFRAWELLTGVLLALWMRRGNRGADILAPTGLALILVSILFVQSDGFPGWQALLPVAGTAMLLSVPGREVPVNRILSHPVAVGIGLISYSLYLWHWPVLVLSTYWAGPYSGPIETAGWLALAVVLAVVSYALIERPLRRPGALPARKLVLGTIGTAAAVLAAGAVIFVRDGLPGRFDEAARAHIAASQDFLQDWSRCGIASEGPYEGIETCAIGPDGPPEVIVWGDSHLRALMDGIGLAALEAETPGLLIWHAGCPPMFGLLKEESAATPAEDAACATANAQMQMALAAQDTASRIILVGRWTYYAEGAGIGADAENTITLTGAGASTADDGDQAEIFAGALGVTVAELSRHFDQVFIARQVPEIPNYDSRVVAKALAHHRLTADALNPYTHVTEEALAARVASSERPIQALAAEGAVTILDTWPQLCPDRCSVMIDDQPVYFDNNHLTNRGALILRRVFLPALSGAAP